MRSFARGEALSVLGVLFLASALFAQSLTVRVPKGNVRARPQTTSPIIGKIKKRRAVRCRSPSRGLVQVLLDTGREGWVFKSLVTLAP